MDAAARAQLVSLANARLKMADDALTRAGHAESDEARRILAEAADALDNLRYRDGLSIGVSLLDGELARLQDEVENRKEAVRRRRSELPPKHN
jgi:hypothetical protein